jgi:hypothetical protein
MTSGARRCISSGISSFEFSTFGEGEGGGEASVTPIDLSGGGAWVGGWGGVGWGRA